MSEKQQLDERLVTLTSSPSRLQLPPHLTEENGPPEEEKCTVAVIATQTSPKKEQEKKCEVSAVNLNLAQQLDIEYKSPKMNKVVQKLKHDLSKAFYPSSRDDLHKVLESAEKFCFIQTVEPIEAHES